MTKWFPEVARALARVLGGPHVTDGEVVVLDDLGRSDFDKLHARALRRRLLPGMPPAAYCAFDVLVLDGESVMGRPLLDRKAMLLPLLEGVPSVLPVGYLDSHGRAISDQYVLGPKLEGIVAKRIDSIYRPGVRSSDWVKVKRNGAVPAGRFSRKVSLADTETP